MKMIQSTSSFDFEEPHSPPCAEGVENEDADDNSLPPSELQLPPDEECHPVPELESDDDERCLPPSELRLTEASPVLRTMVKSDTRSRGRCPCCRLMVPGPFTCSHCIQRGVFFHSSGLRGGLGPPMLPHTFIEIQSLMLQRKVERLTVHDQCLVFLKETKKNQELGLEIRRLKQRVEWSKASIEERRCRLNRHSVALRNGSQRQDRLREMLKQRMPLRDQWTERIKKIDRNIARERKRLEGLSRCLSSTRRQFMRTIISDIFSVEEKLEVPTEPETVEGGKLLSVCLAELEEARHVVYVEGHWVEEPPAEPTTLSPDERESVTPPRQDHESSLEAENYISSILGIHVPAVWSAEALSNRRGVLVSCLMHVSHLLLILEKVLGLMLPCRLVLKSVVRTIAAGQEQELLRLLEKVRMNVLYLASVSPGGVPHPACVLPNIYRLLSHTSQSIGWIPEMTTGTFANFARAKVEGITNIDSDSDEEVEGGFGFSAAEWESVPSSHSVPAMTESGGVNTSSNILASAVSSLLRFAYR